MLFFLYVVISGELPWNFEGLLLNSGYAPVCFIIRLNIYNKKTFEREKFNVKKTEITFYCFKQFLSVDIYMDIYLCTSNVMEIQLKYFVFFFMFLKEKAVK